MVRAPWKGAALTSIVAMAAGILTGGWSATVTLAASAGPGSQARLESRSVLLSAERIDRESVAKWERDGYQVVIECQGDLPALKQAALLVRSIQGQVDYFIEIGRCPELADQHPLWMASLQGHDAWRREREIRQPAANEVVKNYPWVPVFYREAFDAHLQRVRAALEALPPPQRIWLNDLQGGPSACGCGHPLCRWTADYGPIRTAASLGDEAPARFVAAVKQLAPDAEVVPILTSECEEDDQHTVCGGVGCFEGICWKAFARQLDAVAAESEILGVACFAGAFDRNLPRYGEAGRWTVVALQSFEKMPPLRGGQGVSVNRLVAVVQAWDQDAEWTRQQIQWVEQAGAAGVLICNVPIEQSWEPRIVTVDR